MREIEVRSTVTTEEAGALGQRLRAEFGPPRTESQEDIYFDTPSRDWTGVDPVATWLRLRKASGDRCIVTLKTFTFDTLGNTTDNREVEFEVSSMTSIVAMFSHLGLAAVVEVRKTRDTYDTLTALVSIDHVEGLGHFVEIEAKDSKGNYERGLDKMRALAAHLDIPLRESLKRGYPYALLRRP